VAAPVGGGEAGASEESWESSPSALPGGSLASSRPGCRGRCKEEVLLARGWVGISFGPGLGKGSNGVTDAFPPVNLFVVQIVI
jgi:hypothetical protein